MRGFLLLLAVSYASFAQPLLAHNEFDLNSIKKTIKLHQDKFKGEVSAGLLQTLQSVKFKKKKSGNHQGVEITGIPEKSFLESLGLKNNDIIIGINDTEFSKGGQKFQVLKKLSKGGPLKLRILRNGSKNIIDVNFK